MEVFKSLMSVFFILICVNITLMFALWKATKSKYFMILNLHWIFLAISFVNQIYMAGKEPLLFILVGTIPLFGVHLSMITVFAMMLSIDISWKKVFFLPILNFICIFFLRLLHVDPLWYIMPLIVIDAFLYFYVVFKAYKNHKSEMTFSLKVISVIFVLYAIHTFDYPYFYNRFDLLAIGFSIAFAFEMAFAILFPAAVIEFMSIENERLKHEISVKAQLSHSAKMVALGEMAGGIAHELNNPLAILLILLEKAKNKVANNEEAITILNRAINTSIRMEKIIKGLLTFSREDYDHNFSQVTVDNLINDTLALCLEKYKNNGVRFDIVAPTTTVNFIGNSVQISQVLLNLLNNAYDAVNDLSEKWIKLEVKDMGESVEFSVIDSGNGINQEIANKIFNPFFTTKDIGKGTGLGLSISKGIIDKHNGKLFLDKACNNTKFVFIIPKFHFVKS